MKSVLQSVHMQQSLSVMIMMAMLQRQLPSSVLALLAAL
jgi:hypothetical protein